MMPYQEGYHDQKFTFEEGLFKIDDRSATTSTQDNAFMKDTNYPDPKDLEQGDYVAGSKDKTIQNNRQLPDGMPTHLLMKPPDLKKRLQSC